MEVWASFLAVPSSLFLEDEDKPTVRSHPAMQVDPEARFSLLTPS